MKAAKPQSGRTMLLAGFVSVLFFGFVLVLAGSMAADGVAANAVSLHRANATAGSLALTRAAVSQAMLFGADHESGLVSDGELAIAVDQADLAVGDLRGWVDTLEGGDLQMRLESLAHSSGGVIDLIRSGDVDAAAVAFASLEGDAARVLLELQTEQVAILDTIRSTEGLAGRVGIVARIGVTLIVPMSALLINRQLVRRRFAEAKLRLDAERESQAAKESFIAGISHELRTPLTSIYGFTSVMAETAADSEMAEMAATVRAESSELSRMVEDLIAFAHARSEPRPLRIEELRPADLVAALVEPYASRRPPIHVQACEVVMSTDRATVEHVVRNLLSNAIKHGGEHVGLDVTREGSSVRFTVSDDGSGCDPVILRQAIGAPFRNDGAQALVKGSVGLGLAIAATLAVHVGGRVEHRRVGTWTQFSLVVDGAVVHDALVRAA